MLAYFKARSRGASHKEALDWVIKSRYFFSKRKRIAVRLMFLSESQHPMEDNQIKQLVLCIFKFEVAGIPSERVVSEVKKLIEEAHVRLASKYLECRT
jgi:hypothetical protein